MKRQTHNIVIASLNSFYEHCSSCLKSITSCLVHSVSCAHVPFQCFVLVVSKEHFWFNAKWTRLKKKYFWKQIRNQPCFDISNKRRKTLNGYFCSAISAFQAAALCPPACRRFCSQKRLLYRSRLKSLSAEDPPRFRPKANQFFLLINLLLTFFSAIFWTSFSGERSSRFISSLSSNWGDFWTKSSSTIFRISLLRGEVDPRTKRHGRFLNIFLKRRVN